MQGWAVEHFTHGADMPVRAALLASRSELADRSPQQINVFAKENAETKKLNAALQESKTAFRKGEIEQDLSNLVNTRKPFTWEALKYVGARLEQTRLLILKRP